MKKIFYLFIVLSIVHSSCNSYLDIIPDDIPTLEHAFKDRVRAERYLFTCYSYMPKHGTGDDPGLAGDEIWSNPQRSGNFPNRGFDIIYRGNNSTTPILNYWDGGNGGTALWQGIRDCNIFIENIDKVRDLEEYDKVRWVAEAKFLKAYYHFYLLQLYGPIPIVRENLPISSTPEEVAVYREPVDEVIDYIVELLDEATPDLPFIIDNQIAEAGRITQAVALAVKAKVLVTAASPLFNGNLDYVTMLDKRNVQLFNQSYDPNKWDRALEACRVAIDEAHASGAKLYTYKGNPFGLTAKTIQIITPGQIITDKWNEETIWGWGANIRAGNNSGTNSQFVERFTVAPLHPDHRQFLGAGTWAPTMKAVQMFYSENGVPIEEDKSNYHADPYELVTVLEEDKAIMQPGVVTAKIHLKRESRFYGSIGVDGGWWFGIGRYKENEQWPIKSKMGEFSGRAGIERFSPTSFYIKKLHNLESAFSETVYRDKRWNWPTIRLADIYLLYAEALNETLDAPTEEVYKYVDMIRERAGLAKVSVAWPNHSIYPQKHLTKEGARDIIHRERNIELAFEMHRFYDMRRWKKAMQNFNSPVLGWNIEGEDAATFYQVTNLGTLIYNPRDIFWPIRQSNISVNTNLIQNPGW